MNALLTYLKLKITQAVNKIGDAVSVFLELISWPTWYFAVMTFLMFTVAIEVLNPWVARGYLFLGFLIFGFRKMR